MDAKYQIVEAILRAAEGEKYLDNFKEYGIDISCLKLLNEEDLNIMGVVEEATAQSILKNCSNLQMKLETRTSLGVNKKFIETVLTQITNHLYLHNANLVCAVLRNDITTCDIKLEKACNSLLKSLQLLENDVIQLQNQITPTKTKGNMKKHIFFSTIAAIVIGFGVKSIIMK